MISRFTKMVFCSSLFLVTSCYILFSLIWNDQEECLSENFTRIWNFRLLTPPCLVLSSSHITCDVAGTFSLKLSLPRSTYTKQVRKFSTRNSLLNSLCSGRDCTYKDIWLANPGPPTGDLYVYPNNRILLVGYLEIISKQHVYSYLSIFVTYYYFHTLIRVVEDMNSHTKML